jgi:hypothetical protein
MIFESTGLRNQKLHTLDFRSIFNRGCAKLKIYAGALPASADAAETGILLLTITNNGATVKAKQKIRFTPTPGTANAGVWGITLNGTLVTFTDDGSPTATEICTGLYNAWRVASGLIAATTPACTINNPDVYQKFAFTDNTGTLDIEAATAGVAFDYAASISGAGAGTGSVATAVITADAYGLRFEDAADVASGILEKLASQTWKGTIGVSGVATHARLILDSDSGTLSTTEPRLQMGVSTANSDLNFAGGVQFTAGDIRELSAFPVTAPASS